MKITLIFFLILSLGTSVYGQSGNARMDRQIREMIRDLKMDSITQTKFLEVYSEYGSTMKKAKSMDVSRFTLYMVFKKASSKRDDGMKEILSDKQYKLFKKRQDIIDDEAAERN